jgi:murein DD-endopeptidase MepM/ murein hydrolase activator NlpD
MTFGMTMRFLPAALALTLLAGCGGAGSPLVPQLRPVEGGSISSGLGRRVDHPLKGYVPGLHHHGDDFAVATGSPVRAAMSGTVTFAGWRGGYGNAVVLTHAGGYTTLYGHASALKVTAGQTVHQGDVIALVGSTGLSTGPHLHYELRRDGVAIDPGAFLDDPTPVEVAASVERPMSPEATVRRAPESVPAPKPAIAQALTNAPSLQLPHHVTTAIELEAPAAAPGRSWE